MKLAVILFTAFVLLAHNKGHGQSLTLSMKNAPLEKVFSAIEKQSGYTFLYTDQLLQGTEKIDINVRDASLIQVLDICLKDQPLGYTIVNKTIVIKPKEKIPNASSDTAPALINIKGRITNESAEPIEGASVTIKGTDKGTTSNKDGFFELNGVSEKGELLITGSIIEPVEIDIAGKSFFTVSAKTKITEQEEVVVNAGYYNVKLREATGSISRVDAKTIEKQPVTNPLAAISGRMPGVLIQQTTGTPGGEFKIQIRGRNSLRDDGNEPLYIVDGVPFSTEKTTSYHTSEGVYSNIPSQSSASPLTSINMADIESIEILKDADATAIYGSRGANGVVLITTKKGKIGKTTIDINVYTGIGIANTVSLLNTKQFLANRREAFANDGITPSAIVGDPGYSPELMLWDTTRYTDWQKILIGGRAQTTSIQTSISGGNENTQFLFSLGYRSENSVYPGNTGYKKGSFHLQTNHLSIGKSFSVNINIRGSKDKNDQPNFNFTSLSKKIAPNAPSLYDGNGNLNWENSTWQNPLSQLERTYDADVTNVTANTVFGYKITRNLQFKTSLGVNFLQSGEINKDPHTLTKAPTLGATSATSTTAVCKGTNQSWIIEPQLDWEKKIKKSKLFILVGATFQDQRLERKTDLYIGFPSDALLGNLGSAALNYNYEFVQSLYRYAALFGRLNFNWKGKYIFNLTARRDGSSRFGPGKQFANFGAAGAAWIFSKEKWIQTNIPILSFGKIRASYGTTGNDLIGNYKYLDTYGTNASIGFNSQYQGITWLGPLRLFNPDYSWEINKKFEIAFESRFLNDAISLVVSYFMNRSSSQLVNYTLPMTTGFTGILANLPATVQNTGWEGDLTTINLKEKNSLQWATSVNITVPTNKLIEFPGLETSTYANRYVVGEPLSVEKVYESTGVDPITGLFTFRDVNGDGQISRPSDNTKLVYHRQYFFGGINNSLVFKNLSLDVLFQFVNQSGYSAWSTQRTRLGEPGNVSTIVLDKTVWRKPGDIADMQRMSGSGTNTQVNRAWINYLSSDAVMTDLSYVRLKNISLSYELPKKWTKHLTSRLYFHGQNLLVITNSKGTDPEIILSNLSPLKMFTIGGQITL